MLAALTRVWGQDRAGGERGCGGGGGLIGEVK